MFVRLFTYYFFLLQEFTFSSVISLIYVQDGRVDFINKYKVSNFGIYTSMGCMSSVAVVKLPEPLINQKI